MTRRQTGRLIRASLIAAVVCAAALVGRSDACSTAVWAVSDDLVVVGRNVDWMEVPPTDLWALPRGMQRRGAVEGEALEWTSRYGSVVGVAYGAIVNSGINEAGLVANCQWLATGSHGPRDPSVPGISESQWPQFYVDMFATVAEAVEWTRDNPLQVRGTNMGGAISTQQLTIQDATGDSAIIFYTDGVLRIFHDRRYRIVTNEPAYDVQLENLRQYDGFGGDLPLPGASDAAARFVRGAHYLLNLPEPKDTREALAGIMSVMHSMAQPLRRPDPERPNVSATVYTIVFELTDPAVYFQSISTIYPIWVSLHDLDLSEGSAVLRLPAVNTEDRMGDVATQMTPVDAPFPYAPGA